MSSKNILQRPFRYVHYNITLYLIIINLVVYFFTNVNPQLTGRLIEMLALNPRRVNSGFVWTFITYMFVHGGVSHILFNMIGLFIFGTQVEQEMGSWEFLMFYLIVGTLAGVFSYIFYIFGSISVNLIGASGAIYGIMLAFAVYYPNARLFIFALIPVRSLTLVIIFALFAVFNQVTGNFGSSAHTTHLAGFVFAFLYFLIRLGENPINRWRGFF